MLYRGASTANRWLQRHLSGAALLAMLVIAIAPDARAQGAPAKLYELRIYVAAPGKLADLHARFRDHTLQLFAKHGIENLYYWTMTEGAEGDDLANTLVYLVAHKDRAAAEASWKAFLADPDWQAVSRASEANGPLLAKAPQSIYLNTVDVGVTLPPIAQAQGVSGRIFELRQYNVGEAGLPETVERMKFGEAALFGKHGMQPIEFWTAADKSAFIYLLAHKDRETAKACWQSFFAEMRDFMAKFNARPGAPQPAAGAAPPPRPSFAVRFLTPTEYSPYH
ncbi:MAG: NIPSNAP family protein [Gammaproteobacteria bacterium]|nr:NIPSNAP family protein [Gammaproteobacteria bacterium]